MTEQQLYAEVERTRSEYAHALGSYVVFRRDSGEDPERLGATVSADETLRFKRALDATINRVPEMRRSHVR
jgi:hypothetical protein